MSTKRYVVILTQSKLRANALSDYFRLYFRSFANFVGDDQEVFLRPHWQLQDAITVRSNQVVGSSTTGASVLDAV
jgi:hypothetical protein